MFRTSTFLILCFISLLSQLCFADFHIENFPKKQSELPKLSKIESKILLTEQKLLESNEQILAHLKLNQQQLDHIQKMIDQTHQECEQKVRRRKERLIFKKEYH